MEIRQLDTGQVHARALSGTGVRLVRGRALRRAGPHGPPFGQQLELLVVGKGARDEAAGHDRPEPRDREARSIGSRATRSWCSWPRSRPPGPRARPAGSGAPRPSEETGRIARPGARASRFATSESRPPPSPAGRGRSWSRLRAPETPRIRTMLQMLAGLRITDSSAATTSRTAWIPPAPASMLRTKCSRPGISMRETRTPSHSACEAEVDRDSALLLFRQPVGIDAGQRVDERGFTVIDVTGRADEIPLHGHERKASRPRGGAGDSLPRCPRIEADLKSALKRARSVASRLCACCSRG